MKGNLQHPPKGFGPFAAQLYWKPSRQADVPGPPTATEPEPRDRRPDLVAAFVIFVSIAVIFTCFITLWREPPLEVEEPAPMADAPRILSDPYISVNGGPWVPLSGGIRIKTKAELTREGGISVEWDDTE